MSEFEILEKIKILEDNVEIATKMQPKSMKSTVQTYDIRDSPEFRGVFEVEVMIQALSEQEKIDKDIAS